MRFFERSHVYESDWETVTAAWWVKYPNPAATHVKEIHTVSREIFKSRFSVRRLFYLEYGLPNWVQTMFKSKMEGWGVEEVRVNKEPKCLVAIGHNITFGSFFQMREEIRYTPHPENSSHTLFEQKMQFKVFGFGPIGGSLETAARDSAAGKSSAGVRVMESVIERLNAEGWRKKAEDWVGKTEKRVNEELMDSLSIFEQGRAKD